MIASAEPGKTYRVEASLRVNGAATAPVQLTVKLVCGAEEYETAASGTANNTSWLQLQGDVTLATCSAAVTELKFYVEGPPAGVDIYIDDASIREVY